METMLYKSLGLLCTFSGVFLFVYALVPPSRPKDSVSRFEPETQPGEGSRFVMLFRPLFLPLRPLAARLPLGRWGERVRRMLVSAGLDRELNVTDYTAFQLACGLLFAAMALLLWRDWSLAVFLGLLGLGYSALWLYEKMRARQQEIALSMPNVVDMLSLSVEAGLDFLAAIKRIAEVNRESRDPFLEELGLMYRNIKLGMSTEEALQTMAERVDIQEMHSFVAILVQAQKMGSSIADVLRSQAVRMRQQRFMKAERMGAVASQKLLIPMMLCIFPILFVIIFAPYVLKFIYDR